MPDFTTESLRLKSPKRVCEQTSLSRASLDRLVAAGEFPRPIKITSRRLAFNANEVDAWVAGKVAA